MEGLDKKDKEVILEALRERTAILDKVSREGASKTIRDAACGDLDALYTAWKKFENLANK